MAPRMVFKNMHCQNLKNKRLCVIIMISGFLEKWMTWPHKAQGSRGNNQLELSSTCHLIGRW